MKTLTKRTIIYDDDCPLCAMYTGAFLRTRMLDKEGREKYTQARDSGTYPVDWDRARHEIALVNRSDGSVQYGLDSLMAILAHRWPAMTKVFDWKPFYQGMHTLYKFISYNRKVIAPAPVYGKSDACTPDFHTGYRISYLLFTWVITSLIITSYATYINSLLELRNSFGREFLICGGQLLWQGAFVYSCLRDRRMEYLGNMMTISLGGALLLLPGMWILSAFGAQPIVFACWFLVVATLMLAEHIRRVRLLQAPAWLSATWVLYRILVLILLLSL